ncbi:MAG TPA: hypothetical protein VGM30_14975 [Puia sp.]|jgi:hypothetical protein
MNNSEEFDLTTNKSTDECIQYLITENILLRAQVNALSKMLVPIFGENNGMPPGKAFELLDKIGKEEILKTVESHPLLVDAWRDKLKNDLPGIEFGL